MRQRGQWRSSDCHSLVSPLLDAVNILAADVEAGIKRCLALEAGVVKFVREDIRHG